MTSAQETCLCTCGLSISYYDRSTGEHQHLHPPFCAINNPAKCNKGFSTPHMMLAHHLEGCCQPSEVIQGPRNGNTITKQNMASTSMASILFNGTNHGSNSTSGTLQIHQPSKNSNKTRKQAKKNRADKTRRTVFRPILPAKIKCNYCKMELGDQTSLNIHIQKSFCTDCKICFGSAQTLGKHLELHHTKLVFSLADSGPMAILKGQTVVCYKPSVSSDSFWSNRGVVVGQSATFNNKSIDGAELMEKGTINKKPPLVLELSNKSSSSTENKGQSDTFYDKPSMSSEHTKNKSSDGAELIEKGTINDKPPQVSELSNKSSSSTKNMGQSATVNEKPSMPSVHKCSNGAKDTGRSATIYDTPSVSSEHTSSNSTQLLRQSTVYFKPSHTSVHRYKCSFCPVSYEEETFLERHLEMCHCKYCQKCFCKPSMQRRHLLLHSNSRPLYSCKQCGKTFCLKSSLSDHKTYKKCHIPKRIKKQLSTTGEMTRNNSIDGAKDLDPANESNRDGAEVESQTKEKYNRPYVCELCGRGFLYENGLKQHKRSCYCKECKICLGTRTDYERHKKVHKKPFICSFCGASYYYEERFIEHQTTKCKYANQSTEHESGMATVEKEWHEAHKSHHEAKQDLPYKCVSCLKTFRYENSVESHRENSYCQECQHCFGSPWNLEIHRPKHKERQQTATSELGSEELPKGEGEVEEQLKYKCDWCSQLFWHEASLKKHHRLRCLDCKKCFKHIAYLKSHLHTHTDARLHSCEVCGKSYKFRESLLRHIRENHLIQQPPSFRCRKCNKTFQTSWYLDKHRCVHTMCQLCGKYVQNLTEHRNTRHKEGPFKCHLCTQCFNNTERLRAHVKKHLEADILCKICGDAFVFKYHLDLHMCAKHEGRDIPLSCSDCKLDFPFAWMLERHLKSIPHLKLAKPYKCPDCVTRFSSQTTLAIHRYKHTKDNQSPFECHECKRCFTSQGLLDHHISLKPFACNSCGVRFRSKVLAMEHFQKFHQEYKYSCDICGTCVLDLKELKHHVYNLCKDKEKKATRCEHCSKLFVSRVSLVRHLRLAHPKRKPYSCDCGRAFRHLEYLASHRMGHTGEKCSTCGTCNRGFLHRIALKAHASAVHPKMATIPERNRQLKEIAVESQTNPAKGEGKLHSCKKCPRGFTHRTGLRLHLKAVHQKGSSTTKEASTSRRGVPGHELRAKNANPPVPQKGFTCRHCKRGFVHRTGLRLHMKAVHPRTARVTESMPRGGKVDQVRDLGVSTSSVGGQGGTFMCKHCERQFTHRTDLQLHVKSTHQGKSIAGSNPSTDAPDRTAATGDQPDPTVLINDTSLELELPSRLPSLEWWDGPLPVDMTREELFGEEQVGNL